MLPLEAALVIDEIISSLKYDPHQFTIDVKVSVVGQKIISNGGGGVGAAISAVGRGHGSIVIGNQAIASSGNVDIEIARQKGHESFNQECQALLKVLASISSELRSPAPNESKIRSIIDSIKNTWVPGVIINVVSALVSRAFGA